MRLHADHRTVFELQYGMLGRQVAYFERAEDAAAYARMVNEADGEDAPQNLQIEKAFAALDEALTALTERSRRTGATMDAWGAFYEARSRGYDLVAAHHAAQARVAELETRLAEARKVVDAAADWADAWTACDAGASGAGAYLRAREGLLMATVREHRKQSAAGEAGESKPAPVIVNTLASQDGRAFAVYLSDGQKIGIRREGGAAWLRIEPTPIVREQARELEER